MTATTRPLVAPDRRRWFALALLCGAFFMVILDAAIVTVALPTIQRELGFSAQTLQWVVSAYARPSPACCFLAAAPPTCSAAGGSSCSAS